MGIGALATDFTCEDLKWRVSKRDYLFSLIERTQYAGHQISKVEMRPKDVQLQKELGYSKAIGWVQEDQWLIVRADYYDGKGEIFKTFTGGDLEQIDGIWTIRRLTMLNHRARHSAEVRILNVAYHLSLLDEELDPINLLAAQQEPSRKSSPGLEEKGSK